MADLIADGISAGDYVYDIALGEGYVTDVINANALPITVQFVYQGKAVKYNKAGELFSGALQTLYFAAPAISPYSAANKVVSIASLPTGSAIYVSNDNITFTAAVLDRYVAGRVDPVLALDATANVATTAAFYKYARLTP